METEIDKVEDVSDTNSIIHSQKKRQKKEKTQAAVGKLKEGDTRYTFIVKERILETIKALAHHDRNEIKTVMHEALESYIKNRDPNVVELAEKLYKERP